MITPDRIERIKELRAQGIMPSEIVERLGIRIRVVRGVLNGSIPKRPHAGVKWTPEIVAEWRALRKNNWRLSAIAKKYDTSISVIQNKLSEQL